MKSCDSCVSEVTSENDFQWLAQMRYYWENDNCLIRIINATVKYAYEYLGNSARSVTLSLFSTLRVIRVLCNAFPWKIDTHPSPRYYNNIEPVHIRNTFPAKHNTHGQAKYNDDGRFTCTRNICNVLV